MYNTKEVTEVFKRENKHTRIEYRVNNGLWLRCGSAFELQQILPSGQAGQVVLGYRAIDRHGNAENEQTATYDVQSAPCVLCWWNNEVPGSKTGIATGGTIAPR